MTSTKDYKIKVDNKMRWQGDCDTEKKVIRVNKTKSKKKSSVIGTVIHEYKGHGAHPKAHEKTVRKMEKKMLKTMSPKAKQKLYNLIKK